MKIAHAAESVWLIYDFNKSAILGWSVYYVEKAICNQIYVKSRCCWERVFKDYFLGCGIDT